MYKPGMKCVIKSNNAKNNGKIVKVVKYTNKKRNDIVMVEYDNKRFCIEEKYLRKANDCDIIRNLSDEKLRKMFRRIC